MGAGPRCRSPSDVLPAPARPASCAGTRCTSRVREGPARSACSRRHFRRGGRSGSTGPRASARGDRRSNPSQRRWGSRVGQLDGEKQLQRGSAITEWVELLAGYEQHPATFFRDELDEVLHLGLAEERGVRVTDEHNVIGKQIVLGCREGRQCGAVLFAVLGVGGEQDHIQIDRFLAVEIILEVAELVPRLAVNVEDLEFFLTDVDDPFDAVVLGLEFPRLLFDLNDESPLARGRRPVNQLDALGMTVARRVRPALSQGPGRTWGRRSLPGAP